MMHSINWEVEEKKKTPSKIRTRDRRTDCLQKLPVKEKMCTFKAYPTRKLKLMMVKLANLIISWELIFDQ